MVTAWLIFTRIVYATLVGALSIIAVIFLSAMICAYWNNGD